MSEITPLTKNVDSNSYEALLGVMKDLIYGTPNEQGYVAEVNLGGNNYSLPVFGGGLTHESFTADRLEENHLLVPMINALASQMNVLHPTPEAEYASGILQGLESGSVTPAEATTGLQNRFQDHLLTPAAEATQAASEAATPHKPLETAADMNRTLHDILHGTSEPYIIDVGTSTNRTSFPITSTALSAAELQEHAADINFIMTEVPWEIQTGQARMAGQAVEDLMSGTISPEEALAQMGQAYPANGDIPFVVFNKSTGEYHASSMSPEVEAGGRLRDGTGGESIGEPVNDAILAALAQGEIRLGGCSADQESVDLSEPLTPTAAGGVVAGQDQGYSKC